MSLWPQGLQHARPPCPSLSPRVCSSSCPLNWWCYPTTSSSAALFSFYFQSLIFPSIRVFSNESAVHIKWTNYWSFSFTVSPSNEYLRLLSSRIDWFGFLLSKGLSRVFTSTTVWKYQLFSAQPSLWSNLHICTWLLDYGDLIGKVISLLFNTWSRFVIAFLPRSKHLLI